MFIKMYLLLVTGHHGIMFSSTEHVGCTMTLHSLSSL